MRVSRGVAVWRVLGSHKQPPLLFTFLIFTYDGMYIQKRKQELVFSKLGCRSMFVCMSPASREVTIPIHQVEHWCRALLSIMHGNGKLWGIQA